MYSPGAWQSNKRPDGDDISPRVLELCGGSIPPWRAECSDSASWCATPASDMRVARARARPSTVKAWTSCSFKAVLLSCSCLLSSCCLLSCLLLSSVLVGLQRRRAPSDLEMACIGQVYIVIRKSWQALQSHQTTGDEKMSLNLMASTGLLLLRPLT